ncbi:MAG TPA: hypothetical protein VJ986_00885 [Gaiellaceae bacterium]|nr:hypothetical protein [Gaiellaceae bacterium]
MGSRLLPLSLTLCAFLAGVASLQHLSLYLGLLAVPAAAAAAFVSISDVLEGKRALLRAVTSGLALTLIVLGSAVRAGAPHGAAVPPLVAYALVAALIAYALPALVWVLEPVRLPSSGTRSHAHRAAVRMTPTP